MTKNPRILIVEDEALIAMLLERSLEFMGYSVINTVATGEQAISSALTEKPDLILMDIRLAGDLDGYETMHQIRKTYHCEVIFMTGYSDPQLRLKTRDLKPLAYLVKPITPDDLVPYIDKLREK